jgi:hypothetical protein
MTFHEALPERKSAGRAALRWEPADGTSVAGTLAIDTKKASVSYALAEVPTDWRGRAFRLTKLTEGTDTAESYTVFCGDDPEADGCDCKGFTFAKHCKHLDAVRALITNEWA